MTDTTLTYQAAEIIKKRTDIVPKIALVTGSGLDGLVQAIENATVIPYSEIPGFPSTSVAGHGGNLYIGTLEGVPVACLQGRVHFYEGHSNEAMRTMIRTLKLLGCELMFATNSSGSLREEVKPGSLVVLRDHINFSFKNPLIGPNDEEFGPRFVSMENAYDSDFRKLIHRKADELGVELTEGVYFGVSGPTFETPAEIRAYKTLGAEVIGMSTVADVIVARHAGLKVGVISVITNMAAGMQDENLSHKETLANAKHATESLMKLITAVVAQYGKQGGV